MSAYAKELGTLIELLRKISTSTDRVQVEANYNGREWKWKLYQPNITASEWTPREQRSEGEAGNQ